MAMQGPPGESGVADMIGNVWGARSAGSRTTGRCSRCGCGASAESGQPEKPGQLLMSALVKRAQAMEPNISR